MRDTVIYCDAPGCDRTQTSTQQDVNPERWPCASVSVSQPVLHEPECEHDEGWHFDERYDVIDACCVEHLRAAMAVAIATLTDEQDLAGPL